MEKTNFWILLCLVILASLCNSQDYEYDDYDEYNYYDEYNNQKPEDYNDDYSQDLNDYYDQNLLAPPNPPPLPLIPSHIPPPPPMCKMIFFSILNMMNYRLFALNLNRSNCDIENIFV